MTQRTEALAAAFEQAANRIVLAVEGLSDEAWDTAPAGEQRSASQIAYHMAEVYQNVGDWILQAAAGQQLPPLTMEDIHSMNAEQAERYASAGRARALDLLRHNHAACSIASCWSSWPHNRCARRTMRINGCADSRRANGSW